MKSNFSRSLPVVAAIVVSAMSASTFAADAVKVGYIGSLSSDSGLSSLRGTEIAIEELNAAGGFNGQPIELVKADTGDDVTEGIKAYEFLAESEEVDFILSGSIDDVSLGWLPRMQEFQIPTLDTWASYVGMIDMVEKDYDSMKTYFMNIASDEALATLYVDFGKDVLAGKMGWDSVVILQEDTAFGSAITGLVAELLAPEAGIKVVDTIVYDTATVDFGPLFLRAAESGADFIYQISTVNSQIMSSQYVKLRVPMAMTGVNVGAMGLEYWEDTGNAGGGISTLSPIPSVGFELDPESKKFADKYIARYGDSRPKFPHFNGFNAYWGVKQAFSAAEAAGGFDKDKWPPEMLKQDIVLKKDGELWLRYAFWQPGEIEQRTGRAYPHNVRFDITAPYDDGAPSMVVVQWAEDGTPGVIYPEKYANAEFTVPSWVK